MPRLRLLMALRILIMLLLLYCVYELVNTSVMIARMPVLCNTTNQMFVMQLVASILTIMSAITMILRPSKINHVYLKYIIIAAAVVLRTLCILSALNFSNENVGLCYVETSACVWIILQQLTIMFFSLACVDMLRIAIRSPCLILF
jgi:hypothetical protein